MSLFLLLGLLLSFKSTLESRPLLHNKELVKSTSPRSALTELLMQNPELLIPIPKEDPPTVGMTKLTSPLQKSTKHRPRLTSIDTTSSLFSLPLTPPNTPSTSSKPIKIPYADPNFALIKSVEAELISMRNLANEYQLGHPVDAHPFRFEDEIFQMSPEMSATIYEFKSDFSAGTEDSWSSSVESDEFEQKQRAYELERRLRNRHQAHSSDEPEYDSDFDDSKPKECYSLSDSYSCSGSAVSL
jgi:hypothetical protein